MKALRVVTCLHSAGRLGFQNDWLHLIDGMGGHN